MSIVLKKYIREILTEERVTVSRGTESEIYDVKFDKNGNIKQGTKINVDEKLKPLMETAMKLTLAPPALVLSKIESVPTQHEATDPKQMEGILNKDWRDTLTWSAPPRVGRGELAMTLAFKRSKSVKEPDFVSKDGTIRLSVKSPDVEKSASATIMTGGSDVRVSGAVQKLADLLGIKFPTSGVWSETKLRQLLMDMNKSSRKSLIPKIEKNLNEIKTAIVFEHNAQGIMFCDTSNGFYFVNDPSAIRLYAIRFGGTRVEFKGPHGSGSTLENALNEFA